MHTNAANATAARRKMFAIRLSLRLMSAAS
jgi:hypothetical protein